MAFLKQRYAVIAAGQGNLAITVAAIGLLSGCGPTLNWRDVTIGATPLRALFPCKPTMPNRPCHWLAQRSR